MSQINHLQRIFIRDDVQNLSMLTGCHLRCSSHLFPATALGLRKKMHQRRCCFSLRPERKPSSLKTENLNETMLFGNVKLRSLAGPSLLADFEVRVTQPDPYPEEKGFAHDEFQLTKPMDPTATNLRSGHLRESGQGR